MVDAEVKKYTGSCFCGAVSYAATGARDIWYCHCTQCRALTGLYMAAACVDRDSFTVQGDVRWVEVSDNARHGFCANCCSPLFWSNKTRSEISIVAGSFHDVSGLEVKGHIYVAEKGEFYDISDGLPQYDRYPAGGIRS